MLTTRPFQFYKHWAATLLTVLVIVASGCQMAAKKTPEAKPEEKQQEEKPKDTPKTIQKHMDIDIADLMAMKSRLPNAPMGPRPPRIDYLSPEEYFNRSKVVTSDNAITVGADTSKRITIRAHDLGRQHSDALFMELQRNGALTVEREYLEYATEEATRKDGGAPADQQRRYDAHYVIVMHKIADTNGTKDAEPREYDLPVRVLPDEWVRYERERDAYFAQVREMRLAYDEYNDALLAFVQKHAAALKQTADYAKLVDQDKTTPADHKEHESLVTQLRKLLKVVDNTPYEALDPAQVAVYRELVDKKLGMASAPTAEDVYLMFRPDDVVSNEHRRKALVARYRTSYSVRVIDLATSTPVWFGIVEAENVSYVACLEACAKALADAMIYQER